MSWSTPRRDVRGDLGYTAHAQNRSAQISLRTTLTEASGLFERYESFDGPAGDSGSSWLVGALLKFEPALKFTTKASYGPKQISVDVFRPKVLVLAALALDHRCWFAKDDLQPGTQGELVFGTRTVKSTCTATQWETIKNWTTKPSNN